VRTRAALPRRRRVPGQGPRAARAPHPDCSSSRSGRRGRRDRHRASADPVPGPGRRRVPHRRTALPMRACHLWLRLRGARPLHRPMPAAAHRLILIAAGPGPLPTRCRTGGFRPSASCTGRVRPSVPVSDGFWSSLLRVCRRVSVSPVNSRFWRGSCGRTRSASGMPGNRRFSARNRSAQPVRMRGLRVRHMT
jgi:hypothetical protein